MSRMKNIKQEKEISFRRKLFPFRKKINNELLYVPNVPHEKLNKKKKFLLEENYFFLEKK